MKKQMIVIDCQNDFIDGSLACHHSHQAVDKIVEYVLNNPEYDIYYSLDWHSTNNGSFKRNGGIWPDHCVENSWGAALSKKFNRLQKQKPQTSNLFYKGKDDKVEEYSAYFATNFKDEVLHELIDKEVVLCGIASEYCVMETVKELLKDNKKVFLLKDGLGYVDEKTHQKALKEYDRLGVEWIG